MTLRHRLRWPVARCWVSERGHLVSEPGGLGASLALALLPGPAILGRCLCP